MGDDPNFATTVTNSIATKLPLAGGTMTGALVLTGNHLTVDNGYGISSIGGIKYIADSNNDAPSSGAIHNFYTDNGSTSALVIVKSGNVGIGETSPLGKLHVKDGDAGSITPNAAHDTVIIEGDGNTGINIFSPDTSYQYLAFGDDGGSNQGYVRYQHSNDQMVLRAGTTDTIFINDGNVGIGVTANGSWHANWTALQLSLIHI